MAATDQTYRNQWALDVVFGATCLVMLASIIWMFADDYNREWKKEQRSFRDVEEAMAERAALAKLPDPQKLLEAEAEVEKARKDRDRPKADPANPKAESMSDNDRLARIDKALADLQAPIVTSDNEARTIKADLDSRKSFYDLEVERHGPESALAQQYRKDIADLNERWTKAQNEAERNQKQFEDLLRQKDNLERPLKEAEKRLAKLEQDMEIQVKNAQQKRWKFNDWFRSLPIIDAFNSPERINQYTLTELPIDYSFKYVTRFDRCTTCHLGIDRPTYDREALRGLASDPLDNRLSRVALRIAVLGGSDQLASQIDDLVRAVKDKNSEQIRKDREILEKTAAECAQSESWAENKEQLPPLLVPLAQQLTELAADPSSDKAGQVKTQLATLKQNSLVQKERDRQEHFHAALRRPLDKIRENFKPRKVDLASARVHEFSAHPRLDLFVDPNSPHPVEKFGCTGCHQGQGSATDFYFASHTPSTTHQKEQWEKPARDGGHGWSANHDWEFPMSPTRFVETNCLKCHHQVTDLIREGNKIEAPKLVRGYNLVREMGCFGCHEIAGVKGGLTIGPDLRLEPNPPLESLSPEERLKATADPLNPPGAMRKVGPSLYRLSEKTHLDWVKRWIKAPRSFRPTTRMPHFFGLSNNDKEALQDTKQQDFPDTEVDAVAHYLLYESEGYLGNIDTEHKRDYLKLARLFDRVQQGLEDQQKLGKLSADQDKQLQELKAAAKDRKDLEGLLEEKTPSDPAGRKAWRPSYLKKVRTLEDRLELVKAAGGIARSPNLNDIQQRDLEAVKNRLELRARQNEANHGRPETLAERFAQSKGKSTLPDPKNTEQLERQAKLGRRLFTERGCLACHSHQAVATEGVGLIADPSSPDPLKPTIKEIKLPAIDREKYYKDEPTFAPNLSMIQEKLGTDESGKDYESKRTWLIQWLLDPHFHSPRTLMPFTHLEFDEAAAVAAWLLKQPVQETAANWKKVQVPEAQLKALQLLAFANLKKVLSEDEIDQLYNGDFSPANPRMGDLGEDEQELVEMIGNKRSLSMADSLRWYVGKRAIGRLGCFGCHNVPGYDTAKPIGAPLNDWGKKDPDRLAFEDIDAFVRGHYDIVPSLTDSKGKPVQGKNGKAPYEELFFAALEHHSRESFLHQKLTEPRSYDYNRLRDWDDRLRMPQFKFARTKPRPGESDADFSARANVEEAEAREAVMTFILGLVAEPIPAKYVNAPTPERLAEVKGRKVLDKYNCSSCHLLSPGSYDFQLTPDLLKEDEVRTNLQGAHDRDKGSWAKDHFFPDHNAWQSQQVVPENPDHIVLHGVLRGPKEQPFLFLTDAARFRDKEGLKDIRAFGFFAFPPKKEGTPYPLRHAVPAWGGNFGDMLVPYFIEVYHGQLNQLNYKPDDELGENGYARSSVPPLLLREGEKVQSNWLAEFLRNPISLRPIAKLRMPRFNMSHEEAAALANYFGSVARRDNPGIGVTFPYSETPEKEPGYLAGRNKEYADRLKRLKDKDQTEFQKRLDKLNQMWMDEKDKSLVKDLKELSEAWEQNAYTVDGFRLLTNSETCTKCHQLGNLKAGQAEGGPALDLAQDRLRSDWVLRWGSYPQRFLTFDSVMTQYFPSDATSFPELYALTPGDSPEAKRKAAADQARAARDMLMNLRQVADLPINRLIARHLPPPTPTPAGGK